MKTFPSTYLGLSLLALGCAANSGASVPDAVPASDAGSLSDAAIFVCDAQYMEKDEAINNYYSGGTPEATRLTFSKGAPAVSLCGRIDTRQDDGTVADADFYAVTITGEQAVNVRFELYAPNGALANNLAMDIWRDKPSLITISDFRKNAALFSGAELEPGVYWVGVVALSPSESVDYKITIRENPYSCSTPKSSPDYEESQDGEESTDNDVINLHITQQPPATLTRNEDEAEPSNLMLQIDTPVVLRGTADKREDSSDDYADRDTFRFHASADVNELEVHLTWGDEATTADLDAILFAAEDLSQVYSPSLGIPGLSGEASTMLIDDDRDYWLWIGAFTGENDGGDLPVDYKITLCPRHFSPE